MIYATFLAHYFITTSTIFAFKSCIAIVKVYYVKFSSWGFFWCRSMLCPGLPNSFCNSMQSMASQICDDPCADVGGARGATVGRYPQPSGEVSAGMISSTLAHLSNQMTSYQCKSCEASWHTPGLLLQHSGILQMTFSTATIWNLAIQKPSQFLSWLDSRKDYRHPLWDLLVVSHWRE